MILLISPRFLPSSSCSATRNVPLSAEEIGRKNCKIKGGEEKEEEESKVGLVGQITPR